VKTPILMLRRNNQRDIERDIERDMPGKRKTNKSKALHGMGHGAGHGAGHGTVENGGRDTGTNTSVPCPVRPDPDPFASGKSNLELLDRVAFEMEQSWGVDVLRLHVKAELRDKFDKMLEMLNDAIASDDQDRIDKCAGGMTRAWRALDAAARESGIKPARESVWVGKTNDGELVCVYTSAASIGELPRDVPRFHIDELVKFIPANVLHVKRVFEGAIVEDVRNKTEELGNDEVPF
jgi:hypothetical protein